MKSKLLTVSLVLFFLTIFSQPANAAEVELTLSDDTYIFNNSADSIYGASNSLTVASDEQGFKLILLKFSTSKIPAGSTINSADLLMTSSSCLGSYTQPQLRLTHADRDWNEETLRWTTRPRSATDIDVIDGKPQVKSFDVTQAVTQWFNGTRANYGVIVELNGGPYSCNFSSKERSSTAVNLIVNYTAPAKNLIIPNKLNDITLQNVDLDIDTDLAVSPTITVASSLTPTTALPVTSATITIQPQTSITDIPQQPTTELDESLQQQNNMLTPSQMILGLVILVIVLSFILLMTVLKKSPTTTVVVESGHSHTQKKEHKKEATEEQESEEESENTQ